MLKVELSAQGWATLQTPQPNFFLLLIYNWFLFSSQDVHRWGLWCRRQQRCSAMPSVVLASGDGGDSQFNSGKMPFLLTFLTFQATVEALSYRSLSSSAFL